MDNKGDSLPTDGLHAPRLGNSGLHWGREGVWVMLVDGSDMSDMNTYLPYLAIPSPLIGRRRATRPRPRTRTRTHVRSGIKQEWFV